MFHLQMALYEDASITLIQLRNIPRFVAFCRLFHRVYVERRVLDPFVMYSSNRIVRQIHFAIALDILCFSFLHSSFCVVCSAFPLFSEMVVRRLFGCAPMNSVLEGTTFRSLAPIKSTGMELCNHLVQLHPRLSED